jgi:predicted signal transduction protein with EAL and GGDEF domain
MTLLEIMGVDQTISASIGICFYPEDGNRVQELMEKADIALYRSKNSGRNLFAFFNMAIVMVQEMLAKGTYVCYNEGKQA